MLYACLVRMRHRSDCASLTYSALLLLRSARIRVGSPPVWRGNGGQFDRCERRIKKRNALEHSLPMGVPETRRLRCGLAGEALPSPNRQSQQRRAEQHEGSRLGSVGNNRVRSGRPFFEPGRVVLRTGTIEQHPAGSRWRKPHEPSSC